MKYWNAAIADTHRVYGHFSVIKLLLGLITRRTFRPVVSLRLCQFLAQSKFPIRVLLPFAKLVHRLFTHIAAIDLAWNTTIAPGFCITHGWGMVVTHGAKIGHNVTLFHGVTIGRRDRIDREGHRLIEFPIIEDEVWIGPNAIIVGGVRIGKGSRIAGGAYVTENVPPYSIYSGNPGTIVKSGCAPDVMNPAPINDELEPMP